LLNFFKNKLLWLQLNTKSKINCENSGYKVVLLTDAGAVWIFHVTGFAHETLWSVADLAIAVSAGCQINHKTTISLSQHDYHDLPW